MSLGDGFEASRVQVTYRADNGEFADTTLDRLAASDVVAGLPVREFRSYKGREHYSGWYWSSTLARLVVYESTRWINRKPEPPQSQRTRAGPGKGGPPYMRYSLTTEGHTAAIRELSSRGQLAAGPAEPPAVRA